MRNRYNINYLECDCPEGVEPKYELINEKYVGGSPRLSKIGGYAFIVVGLLFFIGAISSIGEIGFLSIIFGLIFGCFLTYNGYKLMISKAKVRADAHCKKCNYKYRVYFEETYTNWQA